MYHVILLENYIMKRFILICSLVVLISSNLKAQKRPGTPGNISFSQSSHRVEAYDFIEIVLNVKKPTAANPFADVSIDGTFQKNPEQVIRVKGFCDLPDGSLYKIRFMPTSTGDYTYSVTFRQGTFKKTHQGKFQAIEGKRRGLLRVDPVNHWHFIWEGTGEHYFWNGTTTYYLMGWDDETIRKVIDRLHKLKVNRLRVLLYGRNNPKPWRQPIVPTDKFQLHLNPWPAKRPDDIKNPGFDLARFNISHWQKYERLLRYAREKDIIVSVIFFIGGQVLPTPFVAGSEDEHRYYQYAIARLAPFSNVNWDLGNEHNYHRKIPGWADTLGHLVKKWDPYDHLTSAHNVIYRNPDSTWLDMQLIQQWDQGQNAYMLEHRAAQANIGRIIPQVNEEYGYEDLWEKKHIGLRAAETRRRLAWEIYMAGCYQTAGESSRTGTGMPPDTGGGWVNGRGDDTMTMLKGYSYIVDFFQGFDWWKTTPRNDLTEGDAMCLAQPGYLYVIYLPKGGNATIKLDPGNYFAQWYNPRNGEWSHSRPSTAKGPTWTSPKTRDNQDWVLFLKKNP